MNKLNVILNGKIVDGNPGETILQLAKRNGIDIPTLCNDDRLEPYSSCYVCVVEIEGAKSLQPSCSTKIAEGMKINTDNEKVKKSRKTALELLLSNHYADCVAPCKQTCPAGVDVQGYIALIDKGMYREAVGLIKQTNPLPAICGRVCVRPCELACRRNLLEETGVGIDYLKRFASDIDLNSENKFIPEVKAKTGKKVAVIGAGPGGLTSAYYLALEGHDVEIFEASPNPGGMLRYGIPPYRLPNEIIDQETKNITDLGVKIHYNTKLGKDISYVDLKKDFNSVVLTIGSQSGTSIGCENDDAENVLSGIDFLRNMEMTGQKYDFTGKKVATIGGGNTAMDCCRTAMRCGAEKSYVIYRRTEKEMPANPIEIHESKLEGIEYLLLTAPSKVNKDENGKLKSLTCMKMALGEPDASGRRRPVVVEGSEFTVELDYILAAIGQKTVVNFIDDINNAGEEKLVLTKWGDVEADKLTLQTSIKSVFAAGDGVTGPATLIEAIAQGKKAANSCHQFLMGLPIEPVKYEFISKRDNFQKQIAEDYLNDYQKQERKEMPTLSPNVRKNFNEVELGYDFEAASKEVHRCLECGCVEYYSCDLKKYATEYGAVQQKYGGAYGKTKVDFSHPYIEIDNNKCILCSRCVRVCSDVVGAKALGLVNRGFDTFVAPSMAGSLTETDCESCGSCISACPTGAITPNYNFKPGPFALESYTTICNYCSVGCEIKVHHKNGFVVKVTGQKGLINKDGNICKYPRFGFEFLNDTTRITKPLLKVNGKFEEIEFDQAYQIITDKIKAVQPDENGFYAGARLTNEELYLIQKFARAAVKTNNISSFHYSDRGGYIKNNIANTPFEQISKANKIFLVGSEINKENAVVGFMINTAVKNGATLEIVAKSETNSMHKKVSKTSVVKSYYFFAKAVNHYLLSNNLENALFINDNCTGFAQYKSSLLNEKFEDLVEASGVCCEEIISTFANGYNTDMNALIVFSEKHLSSNSCKELYNMAMITGKLGKTSQGLISLKEKNNSQGLFDMGSCALIGVGGVPITNDSIQQKMKTVWNVNELSLNVNEDQFGLLMDTKLKNLFIFGEDPIGCSNGRIDISQVLTSVQFKVVQDYFMTDTAKVADLILPASFPAEIGGSFSNTQKFIQQFGKNTQSKLENNSGEQLIDLLNKFGVSSNFENAEDVMAEAMKLLPSEEKTLAFEFEYSTENNCAKKFNSGCDSLTARIENEFLNAFKN